MFSWVPSDPGMLSDRAARLAELGCDLSPSWAAERRERAGDSLLTQMGCGCVSTLLSLFDLLPELPQFAISLVEITAKSFSRRLWAFFHFSRTLRGIALLSLSNYGDAATESAR